MDGLFRFVFFPLFFFSFLQEREERTGKGQGGSVERGRKGGRGEGGRKGVREEGMDGGRERGGRVYFSLMQWG